MDKNHIVKMNLESGDIFATKGEGFLGRLSSGLMDPPTDRFHFGLIWLKVDDDYLILESIGKGIAVGRLSFYEGKDVKFYRVDCPAELRSQAPVELTRWGRSKYDYLLILKIAIQGLWLVFKHLVTKGKLRRIRPEELSWCHNNSFVCTEAVDIAYDGVGVNIVPVDTPPVPAAFRQAELEGRMAEIEGV